MAARLCNLISTLYTSINNIYPINHWVEPLKSNALKLSGGISLVGAFTIHNNNEADKTEPCSCSQHTPAHINELLYAPTPFNTAVLQQCPAMHQFCPPKYLSNSHLQTIVASLYRLSPSNETAPFNLLQSLTSYLPLVSHIQSYIDGSKQNAVQQLPNDPNVTNESHTVNTHKINYTRQLVTLADGGTVSLDWHTRTDTPLKQRKTPVLLALHGLTGGSLEAYMQWLVHAVSRNTQCQVVVMNARGCANTELTTPKPFNAANTDDLRQVIQLIRKDVIDADTPIYAVGVSLGSGILLKYVYEESLKYKQSAAAQQHHNSNAVKQVGGLNASMHICTSFDHLHNTVSMEENLVNFYLYNKTLGSNLVAYLRNHDNVFIQNLHKLTDRFSLAAAYASSYIGEFDRNVIVPLFGYRDVQHYYSDASTKHALRDVEIPCFVLSAKDDPICSASCIDTEAVKHNDNVIMCLTQHGGHVGMIEQSSTDKDGRDSIHSTGYHHLPVNVESYLEKPIVQFINAVDKQRTASQ